MCYNRVGREIEQRDGYHEPRRERDHVLEGAHAPAGMRDDSGGTNEIGAGGDCRVRERGRVQPVLMSSLSAAAATASLNAGAGARSHDWMPHSLSSSDARSSRFMLLSR